MHVVTGRLILRDFKNSDWEDLHRLYMNPETVKYNPSGYPENEEASKKIVAGWAGQPDNAAREAYTAAIISKIDVRFVGVISLDLGNHKYRKGEIWYKLLPDCWGHGLATEATKAMLAFGFEQLQLHRIECGCSIHNVASFKVMEKVGMTREGIKRKVLPLDNDWHDAYLYAILDEDYINKGVSGGEIYYLLSGICIFASPKVMHMRNKWIVVILISALSFFVACSKSSSDNSTPSTDPVVDTSTGPAVDYSKCLLSSVNFVSQQNMPSYKDPFTLEYDSLKRVVRKVAGGMYDTYTYETGKITQRTYVNSVEPINLIGRLVYTLDNNGRVISYTYASYNRPRSETDYTRIDRIDYLYNADGYRTSLKWYAFSTDLWIESKFTYQDGNLMQRENIYYNTNGGAKADVDSISYTYDNTAYFPEAIHLQEMDYFYSDIRTFKPNKNNVTRIQIKKYDGSGLNRDYYTTIDYSYSTKGSRLEKATMAATTFKGYNINTTISFNYKCD